MANTYQLLCGFHNNAGNFWSNVFHFQLTESGSSDAYGYAEALIAAFQASNETNYLKCFGSDTLLDFISAKRVSGAGGPSATLIDGNIGTGTGIGVSAGLAGDIAWQTDSATNRPGHSYLPNFPHGAISGDVFQVGYQGDVGNFTQDMLTDLTLAGGLGTATFGVLTRKTKTFNSAKSGQLKPKPTMLNKRTLPMV